MRNAWRSLQAILYFSVEVKSPKHSPTPITPQKSASGVESTKIPAGPVPARSDHSPRCGNAVCSPNTAPSFAQIRVPTGTESAPVHRRPDGKVGRKFAEGRAVRETESHSPLLSPSRHPK